MRPMLAFTAAVLLGSAPAYAAPAEQSDYICAVTDDAGEAETLRYSIDLNAKAWCSDKDECREIMTVFGVQGDKLVLESSTLEVTSFETSIDTTTGAYDSKVSITEPAITTHSRGTCKPAPFTPFKVKVDGSKIRGG